VAIVVIYIWVAPEWALRKQILEELCVFALFCIDMVVFFYRDGFRAAAHSDAEPCAEEERLAEDKVAWVTEPDQAYFGYLEAPSFTV
jgi:hypothetical protein